MCQGAQCFLPPSNQTVFFLDSNFLDVPERVSSYLDVCQSYQRRGLRLRSSMVTLCMSTSELGVKISGWVIFDYAMVGGLGG